MPRLNKKKALPFPALKVDKRRLFLEFAPKIYLEKEIQKLEDELKILWTNRSAPKYSTNVKIAMAQGNLENYQKSLESILKEEKQCYRRMYKEAIEQTEKRATKGDDAATFRLIKWDKEWLFKDWVKSRILASEATGEKEFLIGISDALKQSSRKKRTTHPKLLLFLRQLRSAGGFDFNNGRLVNGLRETLLKRFEDMGVPESDPVFHLLLDRNYFNSVLKERGFKGRKKT